MTTTAQARAFGSTRETSAEIAQAILDITGGVETEAHAIWAEPTEAQGIDIIVAAFAMTGEDELYWGQETLRRDRDLPGAAKQEG